MNMLSSFSGVLAKTRGTSLAPDLWGEMQALARHRMDSGSRFSALLKAIVLDNATMAEGLAHVLTRQNIDSFVSSKDLLDLFLSVYKENPDLVVAAETDLNAATKRDPAATDALIPFLYFKGFHALQTHRIANRLWQTGPTDEALFLQNRSSVLYGVDIHPGAKIGLGIMLDHATGLVIGETSVVGDNVSMLHHVTLGGTGKERGDRHPKIRNGVMIGAGASILGNVEIGEGACIAAGSVVLQNIPPHKTAAGIPARIVGSPKTEAPALEMDQAVIPD